MTDWATNGDWARNNDWFGLPRVGNWTAGAVDWRVELALGALGGLGSLWDYGLWDTTGIWSGPEPEWVDISTDAQRVTTSRGRDRWGQRMRTGNATVELSNTDGRYNPDAGAAPPGDLSLRPGRLARISAAAGAGWVPVFTGYINSLDPSYGQGGQDPVMRLTLQGFAGSLQQFNPPDLTVPIAAGQSTDDRVRQVLAAYGWNETEWPSIIQTGAHTMAESYLAATGLEELQRAAEAEGGAYFHAADGSPRFKAFQWLLNDARSTVVQLDIGDLTDADSPEVIDVQPSWDALSIINDAQYTRKGSSTPVRVESVISQSLYGWKALRKSVECETDAQLLALATDAVERNQFDRRRLDSLTLHAPNGIAAAAMFGLQIGDLVAATVTTLHGWEYSVEAHINGIGFVVSGSDWSQILRLDDTFTVEVPLPST